MKIEKRGNQTIKKKYLVGVVMIMVLVIGGKMYINDKEKRENEAYLIEQQTLLAKQIKNTFADIVEIKFDGDSIHENKLAGFTTINVEIKTQVGKFNLGVDIPAEKDEKKLTSYVGEEPKAGITETPVKIIYSNQKLNNNDRKRIR